MENEQTKKATIAALDQMIRHADKGPSGFWVDDYEGCGNPAIFPEFQDGLKCGKLVEKKHTLCPWNTGVLYGAGHGNLRTGCYYSCSIDCANYLRAQELRAILTRFKTRLQNGEYEHLDRLPPLLSDYERRIIQKRRQVKKSEERQLENKRRRIRSQKAADLIRKYPDKEALLAAYYGEDHIATTEDGILFFRPGSQTDVAGAESMSYDEYLNVQFASLGYKYRSGFAMGLFSILLEFKGQIEKIRSEYVCFKRILICGLYPDGEHFESKEDHVWMAKNGFEGLSVGDSVLFGAEVYRYLKTGNGKHIDYGLRNPTDIQKIPDYMLPSDDKLIRQTVKQIICETCFLSEHCDRYVCQMDTRQKCLLEEEMFLSIKAGVEKEMQR